MSASIGRLTCKCKVPSPPQMASLLEVPPRGFSGQRSKTAYTLAEEGSPRPQKHQCHSSVLFPMKTMSIVQLLPPVVYV